MEEWESVWLGMKGSWSETSGEIWSSWCPRNLILGADAIVLWYQQVVSGCFLASPCSEMGTGKQFLPMQTEAGLTATQAGSEQKGLSAA